MLEPTTDEYSHEKVKTKKPFGGKQHLKETLPANHRSPFFNPYYDEENGSRNVEANARAKVLMESGVEVVSKVGKVGFKGTKGFVQDFKEFIESRNVIDVAIAFVMGYAFRDVCRSIVNDVVGPLISLILPLGSLKHKFTVLRSSNDGAAYNTRELAQAAGAITLNWGHFLQTIMDFLLLCFCLFLFAKLFYFQFIRKEDPEAKWSCPYCREDVKKGAMRCSHCTSQPIIEPSSSSSDEDEERKQKMKKTDKSRFVWS